MTALSWTRTAPTEPGYYFMRRAPDHPGVPNVDVAVVYYQGADMGQPDIDGGLYCSGANYHGGKMSDFRLADVEWAGPLTPPPEPSS